MRARINERIARAARFPLTLIVAPAGFGKTIALRDYLSTARVDAVRYDVPREDDSLLAFARGLAGAFGSIVPDVAATWPAMQQRVSNSRSPVAEIGEWFAEHLRRVVATVVVDDLHHAAVDPNVVPFVVDAIERTTGRIKWIIASRSDLGLPVASWLGYGRIDVPIGEDDLRFSPQEALAAAAETPDEIAPSEIEALRDLVSGWPVALNIALRTRSHAVDLRAATAGAREMLYRYLTEQIYESLDVEQRRFLLNTSVFSSFDLEIVDELGGNAELVAHLKRGAGFLSEEPAGVYRYHDLFRDFLENELAREDPRRRRDILIHAGLLLLRQRQHARALALFTRAEAREHITELLAGEGIWLFERGESEVLRAALGLLSAGDQRGDARILGLKAMLEAGRGAFELAERDFADAIERARESDVRAMLVHRYAIEMIRHGRDASELLASYASDETLAPGLRVPILGTYATALARHGRLDEALNTVAAAGSIVDASVSDEVRARFYQQAAYVHHLSPSRGDAWKYAQIAVELAQARGLYDVAARAYSVLYVIVYDDDDDPIESLAILDRLIEAARKSGSQQARLYGLFVSYDIEVDRGNDVGIELLESEIAQMMVALPQTREEALLPALAQRKAWEGDFEGAYHILAGTVQNQSGGDRRALRAAEIALYAIASGRAAEGEAAIHEAQTLLGTITGSGRRVARTRLMLALCDLLRGRGASAHRAIAQAERLLPPRSRHLRAFAQVLGILYRRTLGENEPAALEAGLERLRAHNFGGIARLLAALPYAAPEASNYALLTVAERNILIALARGASSKEIAAESGRSAQTIDTHIRSICRKLNCHGRREAVTLALRSGWVKS